MFGREKEMMGLGSTNIDFLINVSVLSFLFYQSQIINVLSEKRDDCINPNHAADTSLDNHINII